MNLSADDTAAFAAVLDHAQTAATTTTRLSDGGPLDIRDAYRVQHALLATRQSRGEHIVGLKLGFTSRAKALQMGVHDVILGTLTDRMRIPDGGVFDRTSGIHPRIEPEVAYLLDHEGHVSAVAPALEIIDSRYTDFRFDLGDVVADNTSACAFIIGEWRSPAEISALSNRAVRLEVDGNIVQTGSTAAILGDPSRAQAAADRLADVHDFASNAGGILLAGAATVAVQVPARGVIEATIAGLGGVMVRIEEGVVQ